MSKRYELKLYLIRDNELEFALYDKEAETSQGTTKMIEKKLNRQDKRIKELEKENQNLKSFRATTYGLINDYLLDSDEVNESWREILTEIKEILKDEEELE